MVSREGRGSEQSEAAEARECGSSGSGFSRRSRPASSGWASRFTRAGIFPAFFRGWATLAGFPCTSGGFCRFHHGWNVLD